MQSTRRRDRLESEHAGGHIMAALRAPPPARIWRLEHGGWLPDDGWVGAWVAGCALRSTASACRVAHWTPPAPPIEITRLHAMVSGRVVGVNPMLVYHWELEQRI